MITYANDRPITATQFSALLEASGIHRPVADLPRLQAMLDHADILWTAWDGATLVGVARALTDFSYACYLSDLAVAKAHQAHGIGKTLIDHLAQQIGPEVSLVLLAAPSALDYYPKVGFNKAENAFIKPRKPF